MWDVKRPSLPGEKQMRHSWLFFVLLILLSLSYPMQSAAEPGDTQAEGTGKEYKVGDPALDVLWVDEKNGTYLPLESSFLDETGSTVTLKDLIEGQPCFCLSISIARTVAP